MDRALAKHRIVQINRIPSPPAFLRQFQTRLLRDPLTPTEIEERLPRDPALIAEVLAAASPSANATLQTALDALGLTGLRHILAEKLRSAEATPVDSSHLDVLNESTVRIALLARALARRAPKLDESETFLAALLRDIGKWVLFALDSATYSSCHPDLERDDADALEREIATLGFHHGEAGKWFAESRGLPQQIVDTIWLHHIAPSALSPQCFPTRLITAIELARTLASHSRAGVADTAFPPAVRALASSLGLDTAAIELALQEAAHEWIRLSAEPAQPAITHAAEEETPSVRVPPDPQDDVPALRRRVHRLETLHRTTLAVTPGQSLRSIVRICGDTLRAGLLVAPGVCLATNATGSELLGETWRTLDDPLSDINVDLRTSEDDTNPAPILRAVRELGMGKIEAGWQSQNGGATPTPRDGLIVVPMLHEGRSYGQIVVDSSASNFGVSDADITDLMSYARVLGQMVARCHAEECAGERAEELARSLAAHVPEPARKTEQQTASQTVDQAGRLGRFAGAVARTLDGPLGLISSQAQRMLAKAKDFENHRALDTIVRETRRLNRFRTDLAALAPHSKPHLEPSLINFRIHQFVAMMKSRLERRGIRVQELYAEGLHRVMVDARRLEHVFLNLFNLAEDAMDETGGTLTVQTGATPDRNAVIVQFTHCGQGISATPSGNVFEPFSENSTSTSAIALAVCQTILEEHGGRITLDRGPEGGDTFTIVLPAAAREPAAEPDAPSPEVATGLQTVLIVDDDEAVREILKQTLQMRGYHTLSATDGVEAQTIIGRQHLDIIILDLLMPNRDGLEVLRDLSQRTDAPPVVFMTGNASPQVREDAMALGARSFLLKPFELRRLLAELDALLVPQV